jgi:Ca2+-binding EF-hand superfamily protein
VAPSAHYGSTLAADRDGDGHIEPKEISTIMRCVGTPISDEKARELIDSVDQDKNGKVRARASKPSPQPPRAQLPPPHSPHRALTFPMERYQVEFDEFLGLMARKMLGPDGSNNEIEQAFGLFEADNQPGVVDLRKAREFLMTQGSNHLEKRELDEMFASLQPDANDCVPMEAFRSLDCWKAPLPSDVDASRQPG